MYLWVKIAHISRQGPNSEIRFFAKYRHFESLCNVLRAYLVFGLIWTLFGNLFDKGQFFVVVNGRNWANNQRVWSHWRIFKWSSTTFEFKDLTWESLDAASVWPDVGVKSSLNVSKSCPKSSLSCFNIRVRFFKIAQLVADNFGYFCSILCRQELSKIAQSGHTAWLQTWRQQIPQNPNEIVLLILHSMCLVGFGFCVTQKL